MHSLSTTSAAPLQALDRRTRELLIESAPLMERWAATHCGSKESGGMEEWAKTHDAAQAPPSMSCNWYHGTWQYLRLLDMVAVPRWYEFYQAALSDALSRRPHAQVLISAAADYGMLATLHDAMEEAQATPRIQVYDICRTPLLSCQWYAERHGFTIECACANLLTGDLPKGAFDIIVTDEFLTVIKGEDKPIIVSRWQELLKPGGTLVTTAMIGGATTPELRQGYAERARRLLDGHADSFPQHRNGGRDSLLALFHHFASVHTRHMLSGEDEIRQLFEGFGTVSFHRTVTPGECVNPTESFQIVASTP
jgi:2-polyprenyl-3-methyl-5-hydroxy-6-metoxy-1,4-benzoquinol methylase